MAALQEQPIPLRFARLGGDVDPKSGVKGQCELLENTQSLRLEDGGVEIEKRPGTPSLSTSIFGGGSLSAGAKLQSFGDELVVTDGGALYSWSAVLSQWVARGRVTSVSARMTLVDGAPSGLSPYVDAVAFGSYLLTVVDRNLASIGNGAIRYFVKDTITGVVVASGSFAGTAPRVVVVGSSAFIFFHEKHLNGEINNNLGCRTIAAATPSTISANVTVANNMHEFATTGRVFDVIADTTNSRIVVGYRNTTPTLTLKIWNTNMTAGVAVAYATRDPSSCLGFLKHDFADGSGYVAIGTGADVRCLTFGSASMTVTVDTQVDATVTTAQSATGAVVGGVRKVLFEVPGTGTTANTNTRTKGWDGTTLFEAGRSEGLSSRCWTIGTKLYWLSNHHGPLERSLFLKEWNGTGTTTGDSGISVAGFLLAGDSGGHIGGTAGGSGLGNMLPGVAALSATRFQIACTRVQDAGVATNVQFVGALVDLRFDETQLGSPVAFNRALHIPGAAAKVFDGNTVYEEGFYTSPEAPTLSAPAGGTMTIGARKVFGRWVRRSRTGLIERSVDGAISTVTLTGGAQSILATFPAYRITDTDKRYNTNQIDDTGSGSHPLISLEVLVETAPGSDDYVIMATPANDATADTVAATISSEVAGEEDTDETDNATPPAVLAFCVHRNRLMALSGADNAVWASKEAVEGEAPGFPVENRVIFDAADGVPVGIASDGTSFFVLKRSSVYVLLGEGPNKDGSSPYTYPSPLPAPAGFVGPRAFARSTDGILCQTAKGFHLLDRAGGLQPVPGADAYEGLTVTGGVTLDDRTMALLTTSDGRTLCWDWQLKTWHTWTNQPAVASCIWMNKFVWLESNGKVHVETPGVYSDDSAAAIAMVVKLSWLDMVRAYLKRVEVIGEAMATCTLQFGSSYNYDTATADPTRSLVVAVAGPKAPWILEPDQGYLESYQLTLTESSTTRGVKLSKLLAWVGLLPGSEKYSGAHYAT
jgi:hypothetical protein